MYVENFFHLRYILPTTKPVFGYGGFSEAVYYRTYSRSFEEQESWRDTVKRVTEGVFSIRKDWYIKHNLLWHEAGWQRYASRCAKSLFEMNWMPAGRGLANMGTPLIYERGSMFLYNCAYTEIKERWINDLTWLMDSLMCGSGVGFQAFETGLILKRPSTEINHVVVDTREGWVHSLQLLLEAFASGFNLPTFDYSQLRAKGQPLIKTGGTASGPVPLIKLHDKLKSLCYRYTKDEHYGEKRYVHDR